jgi:hypothetical protein
MSSRAVAAAISLALLVAMAGLWLGRDRDRPASFVGALATPVDVGQGAVASTPDRVTETAASNASSRTQRKEVHRVVIAPNPGTTKPVEQIRFWRQQAMTGDPYASCRFVSVSAGCAMRRAVYSPWARHRTRNLRTTDGELVGEDCEGVSDADVQGRFDALLGAAQRGHVASALMFASGIGASSFIPVPDEVRRFRTHAPQLAWQAFAAGDSDAVVLLWRVYNRVGIEAMPLAGAIEPDPVKAHALDLLMDDLVPDFVVGTAVDAGLSKEQAAQAEALHAEWRATAFAHGKPPRYGMEIERMFDPEKRAVDLCAPDPR